jgi:hypothetical protein
MRYVISIAISFILIILNCKTDIFKRIIRIASNKKITESIVIGWLILSPMLFFVLLFAIANNLSIEVYAPNNTVIISDPNFFKDLILGLPMVVLVLIFILSASNSGEIIENKNTGKSHNKVNILLFRAYVSFFSNYITVCLFAVLILIVLRLNLFELNLFKFVAKYFTSNIELYSENSIKMLVIAILGLIYFIGITVMPINYIMEAFDCHNEQKRNIVEMGKYKLLLFIPIVNIAVMHKIERRIWA